jgi:hypothetical protein
VGFYEPSFLQELLHHDFGAALQRHHLAGAVCGSPTYHFPALKQPGEAKDIRLEGRVIKLIIKSHLGVKMGFASCEQDYREARG